VDLPNTRLRRDDSRPMASSPLIVVPSASSVPSCSEPSRYGLARAEHAERLMRRPTLTAPARAAVSKRRVGTKKRLCDRTKKPMKEKRCAALLKLLDKKRPIQGLLGVHSRYGLHTRAATVFRDTLTEGFSHFVTSMTAPVASGWSGCRVGLTPTGKRRLSTAHTHMRHWRR
jgi:hypothetical protein